MRQFADARAQQLVSELAGKTSSMPFNPDAALYQTAQEMKLGDMKTDEVRFSLGGVNYIAKPRGISRRGRQLVVVPQVTGPALAAPFASSARSAAYDSWTADQPFSNRQHRHMRTDAFSDWESQGVPVFRGSRNDHECLNLSSEKFMPR
jgi:hypothetical protein